MARLTAEELTRIRSRHPMVALTTGRGEVRLCDECKQPWPCDSIRLVTALEEVEQEIARLEHAGDQLLRAAEAQVPELRPLWHELRERLFGGRE